METDLKKLIFEYHIQIFIRELNIEKEKAKIKELQESVENLELENNELRAKKDELERSSSNLTTWNEPKQLDSPQRKYKIDDMRLCIRKIHPSVTEKDLEAYFSQYGTVTDISMPICDKGNHQRYAFITFSNYSKFPLDVKTHEIRGYSFEIARLESRNDSRETKNILASGILNSLTKSDLHNYFSKFGQVLDVKMQNNKGVPNQKVRFAYIRFAEVSAANDAVTSLFHSIKDQIVDVRKSHN